jgi:hypothetical protein
MKITALFLFYYVSGVYRDKFLIPLSGGGACVVQGTLPRKKPDAIVRIIHFFRINDISLFDSPPDTKGLTRCIPPEVGMRVQTSRSALFYGLFLLCD